MTYDRRVGGNGHLENLDRRHNLECFAILKLFREAHGRNATSADEADDWYQKQTWIKPIDPFAVLTPEEIAECDDPQQVTIRRARLASAAPAPNPSGR